MAIFIGVDIGTTHVKVIAVNENSLLICEEKTAYPLYQPREGFCEQNAEEIYRALIDTLKKITQQVPQQEIKTVSFSAAFHSILCVDAAGTALSTAITWADTRSNLYAKQLKKSGLGQLIYGKTGTPIHPMSPLCKIAWIRDQQPELFAAAYKFISIKEYIWFQLFEVFEVDYSIASASGLFDHQNLAWCQESLDFCSLRASSLSVPVSVFTVRKEMNKSVQSDLGIPRDAAFIIGAGDGAMANLGVGAIHPGIAALTIGTSGAIRTTAKAPVTDPGGRLFNYFLTDDLFINGGGINNGGIVLQWFGKTFLQSPFGSENDFTTFFEQVDRISPGSDGLVFLPYILGERAPVWDAEAKGVFIGIRSTHSVGHFMRAVIEGICFTLLQLLETMEETTRIDLIYITGGVTQSASWLEMLADILGKNLRVVNSADASAMGVIYLGMYQSGYLKHWHEVKQFSLLETTYQPQQERRNLYKNNIAVFEQLYESLKPCFELLAQSGSSTNTGKNAI